MSAATQVLAVVPGTIEEVAQSRGRGGDSVRRHAERSTTYQNQRHQDPTGAVHGRIGSKMTKVKQRKSSKKRGYRPKRKVCEFCSDQGKRIDYKDPATLRLYISNRGKIEPRRRTGICARHQRTLAVAVKRARHLALLPYVPEHIRKIAGVGLRD